MARVGPDYARTAVPCGPGADPQRKMHPMDEINWGGMRVADPLARQIEHRGTAGLAYPSLYSTLAAPQGQLKRSPGSPQPDVPAAHAVPWWELRNVGAVRVGVAREAQFRKTLVDPAKFLSPKCKCEPKSPVVTVASEDFEGSSAPGDACPADKANTAIELDNDVVDLDALDDDDGGGGDRGMGEEEEGVWEEDEDEDEDDGDEEEENADENPAKADGEGEEAEAEDDLPDGDNDAADKADEADAEKPGDAPPVDPDSI